MKQVHIFISGVVQDVGYRQFVRSNAGKLGLLGWVKNLPDSRVEAVLQGRMQALEQMLALCRKGPFLSEVKDIEVEWEEGKEQFKDFTIIR